MPRLVLLLAAVATLALVALGCGREDDAEDADAANAPAAEATTGEAAAELSGEVISDGSSTVGPLTTAAAERFREVQPGVNVEVGISGTGGGFERFCAGETDVSNASRPIDEEDEVPLCEENGIEFTELQVAVDALTVVVNPANDWADCLTVEELSTIWAPESEGEVTSWSQVRDGFPDVELALAGAGTDSGTFDYFTDAINGEEGASRSDYTASEDDNTTVQAVEGAEGGLGYFGLSYFLENEDALKALEIENEAGECVPPSPETAQAGDYNPLARPLFVYVKNESLERPEVQAFLRFYLENVDEIATDALFIPPPEDVTAASRSALEAAIES
ncbi:MAG TPA: PstS family phosphate ABC transporter substrate-binding protein [Gaiellaceae bacterium]|nr:PstS family phosphate ABC transporter substrate-binding protein [Gaiellaceae bacterium]